MSEQTDQPDTTPGIFSWHEINTPDQAASVEFYTQLFGWTTTEIEMPGGDTYTMFCSGEKPIAGCVVPPGDSDAPPMWLNYVTVEDVDASIAKTKELGGKVLTDRVDLPMGSFAVVSDPQGATFAFWKFPDEQC